MLLGNPWLECRKHLLFFSISILAPCFVDCLLTIAHWFDGAVNHCSLPFPSQRIVSNPN